MGVRAAQIPLRLCVARDAVPRSDHAARPIREVHIAGTPHPTAVALQEFSDGDRDPHLLRIGADDIELLREGADRGPEELAHVALLDVCALRRRTGTWTLGRHRHSVAVRAILIPRGG